MRVSSTKIDNQSKALTIGIAIATQYVEFHVQHGHKPDICYLSKEEFNNLMRYSYLFSNDTSEPKNSILGMKIVVEG